MSELVENLFWMLNLRMMSVCVEEYLDLAVCFKCSRFCHIGRSCRERACCYKCGSKHDGDWDCPNCKRRGVTRNNRYHSAIDKRCLVYR